MKKSTLLLVLVLTVLLCLAGCNLIVPKPKPHVHSLEELPAVPATCTETGLTAGTKCSVCDEVVTAQETVPALGHNYVDKFCTRCDNELADTQGLAFKEIYDTDNTTVVAYAVSGIGTATETDIAIPQIHNNLPVTQIEGSAFKDKSNIKSVYIPNSVTSVGDYAFSACSSPTNITIPESVTSIGKYAFYCGSLTIYCEATSQPDGWDSSWNSGCPVVWDCNNNEIASDDNIYAIIDGIRYALENDYATVARQPIDVSGEVIISQSVTHNDTTYTVTSIDERAFYNCNLLTSITIPASVTSIGSDAFSGCSSLTLYCHATNQPNGWNSDWNNGRPVVWNCDDKDIATDGYIYTVVDGVRYALKDGIATVIGQPSNVSDSVKIPQSINYKDENYSVTSISNSAFA